MIRHFIITLTYPIIAYSTKFSELFQNEALKLHYTDRYLKVYSDNYVRNRQKRAYWGFDKVFDNMGDWGTQLKKLPKALEGVVVSEYDEYGDQYVSREVLFSNPF